MTESRFKAPVLALGFTLLGAIGAFVASCASSPSGEEEVKGRAQLWEENCSRCHNYRSPSELSDRQWEVVLLHMRVRANLTQEEYEAILEFLKAGN